MTHWYETVCKHCDGDMFDARHKKRCGGTYSRGNAPGFLFCHLERDHDGPCHCPEYSAIAQEPFVTWAVTKTGPGAHDLEFAIVGAEGE